MTPPAHRPFMHWFLDVPRSSADKLEWVTESANVPYILEALSTFSEIAGVARARFAGTMAQRNQLWMHFRNYLRQASSNFEAAQSVPNRSSALLYYYSMLNFAKAELLDTHATQLVNKRIGHGLSFSPTGAKTVFGDKLKVTEGLFPLLYERRTGRSIPIGTSLPVNRILQQVPEIGSQVTEIDGPSCRTWGALQLLAMDSTHSWSLLALASQTALGAPHTASRKLFDSLYAEVAAPAHWRDNFAVSRRLNFPISFHESRVKLPLVSGGISHHTLDIVYGLRDILGMTTSEEWDTWLAPSLYKTKMLPMPPSLARYALTYYASSLVRYKPQMFDSRLFAEQAYLFDAMAREFALPMLIDVYAALRKATVIFQRSGGFRL